VLKIYVMTDMEGASGIVRGDKGFQTPGSPNYAIGQRLLTGDVNAAVQGALDGGADEVIVNDAHGPKTNILIEELHPEAKLETPVSGRRDHYLPGLDDSFAAMFIVGVHAMAGTRRAFLDHTQSSTNVYNYYVNGVKYGEIGQYALIAGHYRAPVVLVTGDLAATVEARELLGENVHVVAVKEAVSRNMARCVHPSKAREMIREAAERALEAIDLVEPLVLDLPLEIRLELQSTELADAYENKPNVKRIDGRTIVCTVESQLDILNF